MVVLSTVSVEEREEYINRLKRTRDVSLSHLDVTHLRGSPISYSTLNGTIRDHFSSVARKSNRGAMSVMVVQESTMSRKGDKEGIYTLLMAEKMLKAQGIHAHLLAGAHCAHYARTSSNMTSSLTMRKPKGLAEVMDPKIADAVRSIHPSITTVALNEIMSLILAGVVEERQMNVIWEVRPTGPNE